MGAAGFVLTTIGAIATVLGAYFAWVAVRRPKNRVAVTATHHPRSSSPACHPVYDVFISYAHDDLGFVEDFADRLGQEGLRVARDELVLRPGTVLVHAIEQAIRDSTHGLMVFSPASVASDWVDQEYASLMSRSIEHRRLFIPVLIGAVSVDDLPEFARTRYFADFRHVSTAQYDELIGDIAEAVRRA